MTAAGNVERDTIERRAGSPGITQRHAIEANVARSGHRPGIGALDDRLLAIEDGEQPARRGKGRGDAKKGRRQSHERFGGRQRQERRHRQIRAGHAARGHERHANGKRHDQGQIAGQPSKRLPESGSASQPTLDLDERAHRLDKPVAMLDESVGDHEGHQAGEIVDHQPAEIRRLCRQRPTWPRRGHGGERRRQKTASGENRDDAGRQRSIVQEQHQSHHGERQKSDGQRRQEPQERQLEPVDIGLEASKQIARAKIVESGRGERHHLGEQMGAGVGEKAQGRLMADHPVDVATAGPQDGQPPDDRRRGEIVHGDAGKTGRRHGGDEPSGRRHQPDIGERRHQRHQHRQQDPTDQPSIEAEKTEQISHAAPPTSKVASMAAKTPPRALSSSGFPSSTSRPPERTSTRSAASTVLRR